MQHVGFMEILPNSCRDLVKAWNSQLEVMEGLRLRIAFNNNVVVCIRKASVLYFISFLPFLAISHQYTWSLPSSRWRGDAH